MTAISGGTPATYITGFGKDGMAHLHEGPGSKRDDKGEDANVIDNQVQTSVAACRAMMNGHPGLKTLWRTR
jgi:hypothetical protein